MVYNNFRCMQSITLQMHAEYYPAGRAEYYPTGSEVIRDPAAGRVGRRPHNHQAGGRC